MPAGCFDILWRAARHNRLRQLCGLLAVQHKGESIMANPFSVTLAQIIKEFSLETIYMPEEPEKILVYSSDVNRPGLQLNGFFEYFDSSRIQIIGKSESAFLDELTPEKRREIFDGLCSRKPPALVLSRSLDTYEEMLEMAERDRVPVLRTDDATSCLLYTSRKRASASCLNAFRCCGNGSILPGRSPYATCSATNSAFS